MTEPLIRSADRDDIPEIRRVARESWHAAYDAILGRDTVESTVREWYAPDRLAGSIGDPGQPFYVALRGDDVIGFVHAVPHYDSDATYQLNRLYLHPDHWRDGIGSRLLARLFEELRARGVDRLRLIVLTENEGGRSFYEAEGFEHVGRREETLFEEREEIYVREI